MSIRISKLSLCSFLLMFSLFFSNLSLAGGFDYQDDADYWDGGDEDTILIEDEATFKISYTKALNAACKNLLGFDLDQYFTAGKNKKSAVIRHLDDLSERSFYRLRLDSDEVIFNFTLNL